MTSIVSLHAFVSSAGLPFAMLVDRKQEYLPRLRPFLGRAAGTERCLSIVPPIVHATKWHSNASAARAIFCRPFSDLLEQSASAGRSLDEVPAEDMHRAVSKISQVYVEICETAERIVASPPRELGHGQEADGMSAGG